MVELQNAGYDVVVLDNLSNSSEKSHDLSPPDVCFSSALVLLYFDVIVSPFFFFHNIFQKYPSDFTKTPSDFTITRIFVRILFIPYTRTSAFLCLCNLAFHIFMQYISFFL